MFYHFSSIKQVKIKYNLQHFLWTSTGKEHLFITYYTSMFYHLYNKILTNFVENYVESVEK